jgi:hypothetical protein
VSRKKYPRGGMKKGWNEDVLFEAGGAGKQEELLCWENRIKPF